MNNNEQLQTVVDPKEFGIEEIKASQIENSFMPKIKERELLDNAFNEILTKELTPELAVEAKRLRNQYVKIRTGIAEIHKVEKQFFLAAGRFCDAIKNRLTLPVEQKEERLFEIEDYFNKIERERIAKIKSDREELLSSYVDNPDSYKSELLSDEAFDNLLTGLKLAFEHKLEKEKEAERIRLEEEREENLKRLRSNLMRPYYDFFKDEVNLGEISDADFEILISEMKAKKDAHDAEIEATRIENERLKKEAEERDRLAIIEAERIEKERKEEAEKQMKIQAAKDEEIRIANEKAAKLEAENKARLIAEEKERKAKEAAEKKAAAAPDRDKLVNWINGMNAGVVEVSDPELSAIAANILIKFNSFKSWALNELKEKSND